MNVGSTFAYEPTHNIATKGANRQSPMTTRMGVTTGPSDTSGAFGIGRLRLLADHVVQAREM
ncbi:hypothetical protein ALMP_63390 [Streptomyces sp. A012304]|nr:hypothetical protein ALMP_63390 [Streptomyces sp. A012304]